MSQSKIRVLANDFEAQWSEIAADSLDAMDRVGRSGWLILGREVQEFESALAHWWGVSHAVGVASGLDAIEVALRSAGLVPGDRVLTTPLTAFATTLAVMRAGGEPVWCDVDESGGLDLEIAAAVLADDARIRFLLPVHLYGHPLDPAALARLAERTGVTVIEDCAQSAGASRDGLPTGVTGRAGATSFYPTKNIGAMGDGGLVLTNDGELAEQARQLRDYGQSSRYVHASLGLNSRLDELQAAILRSAVMPRLDHWLERRRAVAARYTAELNSAGIPLRPIASTGGVSANHLFPIELSEGQPTEFIARLRERNVSAGRHYPFVCQDQGAATGIGYTHEAGIPVARRLAAQEVSLPMHPFLTDDQLDCVVEACVETFDG